MTETKKSKKITGIRKTKHLYLVLFYIDIHGTSIENTNTIAYYKTTETELNEIKINKMLANVEGEDNRTKSKRRSEFLYRELLNISENYHIYDTFLIPINKNVLKDDIEREITIYLDENDKKISDFKFDINKII